MLEWEGERPSHSFFGREEIREGAAVVRERKWLLGLLLLLLFLAVGCRFFSPGVEKDLLPWPTEAVTLWASSDFHWQEPSATPRTPCLDEIIDALLDKAAREGPQALLLCGDLTNDGSLAEHQAISDRLRMAQEGGVRIFVTFGNHDMDRDLSPETLTELYGPFGWDRAISRDESSMSYLARVTDRLWLLSLDCCLYGERGKGVAGAIGEETLSWVKDCLDRAGAEGAMVIPFSHHNLIVHNFSGTTDSYNIDGGDRLEELLLSRGIPLYLSGHRHNSFLARAGSEEGELVESVVATPTAWPHYYTVFTLQPESRVDHSLRTLDVAAWARRMGREEPELLDFNVGSQARDRRQKEEIAVGMMEHMGVPEENRAAMEEYFLDFYDQFQNHRLWEEGERLRRDPGLALWSNYADQNIYARWMPWILENQAEDAPDQLLGPFR